MRRMRLVVAITGASGIVYARKLLETLQRGKIETHLIVSENAEKIIKYEGEKLEELKKLASYTYSVHDLTAPITSGSFKTDGMIIVPCSMKTISDIAHGYSENLITRAADVTLKERRLLVVVPRETPLNVIHLENMLKLAQIGATVLPAMPAFYGKPKNIDDLANFVVGRILDVFNIKHRLYRRWGSLSK
jgi:4-hydroxy-3-polyprenylbenzoate decarboxylase